MITYTTANSVAELEGILQLQKSNLPRNLNTAEIQSQGFVTLDHTYAQLAKLNDLEKHLIAKDGDQVIAYLLAMTVDSRFDLPAIFPMFEAFDSIDYLGQKVSAYHYLVVGQVCVDRAYRGQGILDQCYAAYKRFYGQKYDFAITEIASSNPRSLKAHQRIGFKAIHTYVDLYNTEWIVVVWDWN
jgi:L-amino acid N-acyltransferase YncA